MIRYLQRRCIPDKSTSIHRRRYAPYHDLREDRGDPICIPVHYPKGERIYKGAYNLPDDTRTLVYSQPTQLTLGTCPGGESTSPPGQPGERGCPGQGGASSRCPTLPASGHARVLDNKAKEVARDAGLCQIGRPTRENSCSSSNSKSHVAKLPVMGIVTGLTCYFIGFPDNVSLTQIFLQRTNSIPQFTSTGRKTVQMNCLEIVFAEMC
jgi:hypothetical protein